MNEPECGFLDRPTLSKNRSIQFFSSSTTMSKATAIIVVYSLTFLCNATQFEASKILASSGVEVSLLIDDHNDNVDDDDTVEITIKGPNSVWFGVGFGSSTMTNTYAIIASGTNTVTDHILSKQDLCQCFTGVNPSPITVISDTVTNSIRTVVITRPRLDSSYTFPISAGSLSVISALGLQTTISKHGSSRSGIQ